MSAWKRGGISHEIYLVVGHIFLDDHLECSKTEGKDMIRTLEKFKRRDSCEDISQEVKKISIVNSQKGLGAPVAKLAVFPDLTRFTLNFL